MSFPATLEQRTSHRLASYTFQQNPVDIEGYETQQSFSLRSGTRNKTIGKRRKTSEIEPEPCTTPTEPDEFDSHNLAAFFSTLTTGSPQEMLPALVKLKTVLQKGFCSPQLSTLTLFPNTDTVPPELVQLLFSLNGFETLLPFLDSKHPQEIVETTLLIFNNLCLDIFDSTPAVHTHFSKTLQPVLTAYLYQSIDFECK